MIIRCTQKLLKELQVKPLVPDAISDIESRHANLLRIDKRKSVLFTHDITLFSFLVPGLLRPDFDHFDVVVGGRLVPGATPVRFQPRPDRTNAGVESPYQLCQN